METSLVNLISNLILKIRIPSGFTLLRLMSVMGTVVMLTAGCGQSNSLGAIKEQARDIQCGSNLKQIAFAAKMFALDHDDRLPSRLGDIQQLIVSPQVLACPKDSRNAIHKATSWSQVDFAKSNYELLHPGAAYDDESGVMLVKCRTHGTLGN